MKTRLPNAISTIEEAKLFLTELYNNGESFHPEDDANDLVGDIFTKQEGDILNKLMDDIYNLAGNDGRHINLAFDPCEFLLNLDPEYSKEECMKKPLKKDYTRPFILDGTLVVINNKAYAKALEAYIEYQEKIIANLKAKIK